MTVSATTYRRDRRGHDHMIVEFVTTYATVPITTDVSSNLDQGEVYNIM